MGMDHKVWSPHATDFIGPSFAVVSTGSPFVLISTGSSFAVVSTGSSFAVVSTGSSFVLISTGASFVLVRTGSSFALVRTGSSFAVLRNCQMHTVSLGVCFSLYPLKRPTCFIFSLTPKPKKRRWPWLSVAAKLCPSGVNLQSYTAPLPWPCICKQEQHKTNSRLNQPSKSHILWHIYGSMWVAMLTTHIGYISFHRPMYPPQPDTAIISACS